MIVAVAALQVSWVTVAVAMEEPDVDHAVAPPELDDDQIVAPQAVAPPDPRDPKNECEEVPHKCCVALVPCIGGQLLEHKVTGETHFFPSTNKASIHFHEHYAFVATSTNVEWVNKIFKQSLWKTTDNKLLILHQDSDGWSTQWLDAVSKVDYTMRYIHWSTELEGKLPFTCALVVFPMANPKSVNMFWDLDSCKLFNEKGSPWIREKLCRKWRAYLQELGIDLDQHVKNGRMARGPGAKVEHTSLSTSIFLTVLSKWASRASEHLQGSSADLMQTLITKACCHESFAIPIVVNADLHPNYFAELIGDVQLRVCNFQVCVKPLTHCPKWATIPSATRTHCPFTRNANMALWDFLVALALKPNWRWLFGQVVFAVSKHIDSRWRCISGSQITPPSYDWTYYGRKDAEVRRALAVQALSCKRKATSVPESRTVKAVTTCDWHLAREIRERAWAYSDTVQVVAEPAVRVAICSDASRLGGRDRLHGAMMDMQSGWTWWAPTQVPMNKSACSYVCVVFEI